jgi:hypothetical protein
MRAGARIESETEVVVFFVGADPEPMVIAAPLPSDGTIAPTDFNAVDAAFFLKPQRRMAWIRLEQREILVSDSSNVFGQLMVALPEGRKRGTSRQ